MYFDSIEAMLAMEGHGVFVWSAYAITVMVVAFVLMAPVLRRKRLLRQVSGELRRAAASTRQHSSEVV